MTQQRLTLEQIGARAGVSRSTVSRVINGEPNVSVAVRARVQSVIAETGYRPHAAARSLVSKRTGVIGLAIPSAVATLFDDPYFGRLILGVTGATNAHGMTLALLLSDPGEDDETIVPRVVRPGLVDGLIVTATRIREPLIAHLVDERIPVVVVGRLDDEGVLASVDVDNHGGAKKAATHLASLGRQRLALVNAPLDTGAGLDRRAGFLQGVAEAGLELDGRVAEGDWTAESGQAAMTRLLDSDPDAVFVASDRMAIGVLRAIHDAGLRCPEDVAVVSFDGLIPADQTNPSLTSVTQPVRQVGERAVELLRAMLDGGVDTPERVTFATDLVVRESCGSAPVGSENGSPDPIRVASASSSGAPHPDRVPGQP